MSDAAVARTDHELQMLESLVDCAKTISLAIGEAAKVETDRVRQLELFDAFQRGFFGVRRGIRLALTLRAAPRSRLLGSGSAILPKPACRLWHSHISRDLCRPRSKSPLPLAGRGLGVGV